MVDPTGSCRVADVGEVVLRRDGRQLGVLLRDVEYKGFPIGNGVHCVPGLDVYLRFVSGPGRTRFVVLVFRLPSAPLSARTNE